MYISLEIMCKREQRKKEERTDLTKKKEKSSKKKKSGWERYHYGCHYGVITACANIMDILAGNENIQKNLKIIFLGGFWD